MRKLILLIILTIYAVAIDAQPFCNVRTFTIRDGLAANTISGMGQTSNDLVWFSTWNGLCCYDGYSFSTFRDEQDGEEILTSNRILFIKPDTQGDVWCSSYDRHLYLFDTHQCKFINVSEILQKKFGAEIDVRTIYALPNGHSWVVSRDGGVNFCIDDSLVKHSEGITCYSHSKGNVRGTNIKKVLLDNDGREWIFSDKGATIAGTRFNSPVVFDLMVQIGSTVVLASPDGKIGLYRKGQDGPTMIPLPAGVTSINALAKLDASRIVAATNRGLLIYDISKGDVHIESVRSGAQLSVAVKEIFIDNRRRIWAFSDGNGVTMINTNDWTQQWMAATADNPLLVTRSEAPFMHQDNFGTVWVVPVGGTFSYYDEVSHRLVPYILQSSGLAETDLPTINKFMIDKQNNLWFTGTHNLTLVNFRYHHFAYTQIVSNQEARSVLADSKGRVWTGMYTGEVAVTDGGKNVTGYLSASGMIQSAHTTLSNRIYALFEDSKGRVWIGTKGDGLYLYERNGVLKHFRHNVSDRYSINHDEVYGFDQDDQGRIWVATYGGGPNIVREGTDGRIDFINPSNEMKNYPLKEFDKLRRITHTHGGVILMSTNNGLVTFSSKFTSPGSIRYYANKHIQGDKTSLAASDVMQTMETSDRRIFVITLGGGVQEITSKNLLQDKLAFKRLNKLTATEGLVQSMVEDHRGHIWFARESSMDCYSLRTDSIESFGPNDLGERMEFSEALPSLNPRTGAISMGVTGGVMTFMPQKMKKSRFCPRIIFTGVKYQGDEKLMPILNSDELDVPSDKRNLTIYFAALDYSDNYMVRYAYKIEGVDEDWNYVGNTHSASFNHLPAGHLRLLVRSTNSDGVWTAHVSVLNIYAHPTFWETVWAKLLYLLMMVGFVALALYIYNLRNRSLMERELSEMKTRFFTEISHKLRTPLTLIGGPVTEVLTKEKLGDIARRHLEMVQRNAQRMLELVNKMLEYSKYHNVYISDENASVVYDEDEDTGAVADAGGNGDGNRIKLLIVEDNDDLRAFLVSILCDDYVTIQASDGQQGLEKAMSEMPDFIITDVMMPVMDGLTMVRKIKQTPEICHIPIVVLSAKASLDDRLLGLKEGIDDYITKPFSATYLKQRVENIIRGRQLLQQTYLQQIEPVAGQTYQLDSPRIVDSDNEMMNALMAYLEQHIGNPDLKIEELADAVHLGRTVFYGKIKSIVGMSPVDFLRHVRMQRAEELVAKSRDSFSQIAYAVGFSDPKYFSKCFKKETGMTPSEYRDRASTVE